MDDDTPIAADVGDLIAKALDEGWENYTEAAASAGEDAAREMEKNARAMIDRVNQGFTITEKEGNLDKSAQAAQAEIKRILDHLSHLCTDVIINQYDNKPQS